MPDKPFLSARIPDDLNQAINQHAESTGESRTSILVNALKQYLGFSPNDRQERVPTKLEQLEERLAQLEEVVSQSARKSVISSDNKLDNTNDDPVIKPDNRVKTTQTTMFPLEEEKSDQRMTNKQISNTAGLGYDAVKRRARANIAIMVDGVEWIPIKEESSRFWIPKTDDNSDNKS